MNVRWRLIDKNTNDVVATTLEIADGFWSRFKGLQLRPRLAPGSGLLLVPCPSVHTFFVGFPIDVVMVDSTGGVLAVRPLVAPWRIVPPTRGTHAILELPAGTARVSPGTTLRLQAGVDRFFNLPPSVTFLRDTV